MFHPIKFYDDVAMSLIFIYWGKDLQLTKLSNSSHQKKKVTITPIKIRVLILHINICLVLYINEKFYVKMKFSPNNHLIYVHFSKLATTFQV